MSYFQKIRIKNRQTEIYSIRRHSKLWLRKKIQKNGEFESINQITFVNDNLCLS